MRDHGGDTYPSERLRRHLEPGGPKRILALDGGGVRGIVSLQYLKRIESLLRDRTGNEDLVLSDYFDLIGGTSTGAIIAGGLALGMSVSDLEAMYENLAGLIFKKPLFRFGAIVPKFSKKSLQKSLQAAYGADTKLGSDKIRTGLMLMTKRMDSGSPWPLTNHPADPYYLPVYRKRRIGNANMLLWQVVRASTAAPHYFRPEKMIVGSALNPDDGTQLLDHGQFVDGGVSTANNPSLQLLQVALLDGFRFGWKAGADDLLLVSVGTALRSKKHGHARGLGATAGAFAFKSLLSIMDDCNDLVETMMQWMAASPTARRINGQILDLSKDLLAVGTPLMTYQRYNILLTEAWVKDELGREIQQSRLNAWSAMDRPSNMAPLRELAAASAAKHVKHEHFPPVFDPGGVSVSAPAG